MGWKLEILKKVGNERENVEIRKKYKFGKNLEILVENGNLENKIKLWNFGNNLEIQKKLNVEIIWKFEKYFENWKNIGNLKKTIWKILKKIGNFETIWKFERIWT